MPRSALLGHCVGGCAPRRVCELCLCICHGSRHASGTGSVLRCCQVRAWLSAFGRSAVDLVDVNLAPDTRNHCKRAATGGVLLPQVGQECATGSIFVRVQARGVQVHVFKTSDWAFLGGFDEIERMNEMRELHARLHAAVSAKSKFDEMQRINDGSWPGLKNVTLKKSEPQRRAGGAANGVPAAANGDSGAAASRMAPVAELLGISRSVEGEPPTPDEIALGLRGNTPERRVPEPDRTVHDSVPADDATSEPEHRSPSGRSALVVPAAHSRTQPPKPELADPKHHAHIAGAAAPARHAAETGAWSEAAAAPPASSASLMESRQRLQADAARHMLKMKLLKFYTQHAPDKLQYIDAYTNDYLHRQGALSLAACLSPSALPRLASLHGVSAL